MQPSQKLSTIGALLLASSLALGTPEINAQQHTDNQNQSTQSTQTMELINELNAKEIEVNRLNLEFMGTIKKTYNSPEDRTKADDDIRNEINKLNNEIRDLKQEIMKSEIIDAGGVDELIKIKTLKIKKLNLELEEAKKKPYNSPEARSQATNTISRELHNTSIGITKLRIYKSDTHAEIKRREIQERMAAGLNPFPNDPYNPPTQSRGLSSAQLETVNQLGKELAETTSKGYCLFSPFTASKISIPDSVGVVLKDIHPVLVGKNVVFSKNWLPYIGSQVTPQQFAHLRDNIDKVYTSYTELIGVAPKRGEKVFIDINPQGRTRGTAHAHPGLNAFCLNSESTYMNGFWKEVGKGSWSNVIMHELAHTFTANRDWVREIGFGESIAELMVSYALERNPQAFYGIPGTRSGPHAYTTGTQHRQNRNNANLAAAQRGTIKTFSPNPLEPSLYDYYLQGLVEKAGWKAYAQAFRSYNNDSFTSKYSYEEGPLTGIAMQHLERIAHFSDNPNTLLKSLPDKGQLLQNFKVKIIPIQQATTPAKNAPKGKIVPVTPAEENPQSRP